MPTVYGPLDIVKNELRNAVIQNLGSAPAAPVKGLIYYDSTANILYWYNGSQWIAAQAAAGAVPSDTVTTLAVGGAAAPGSSTLYSRGDHAHGMPAFGTVTAQTTFGQAANSGAAVTIARSDHVHGTPTHLASDHTTIPLSTFAPPTADVPWGGFKITNMASPLTGTDAANKAYVDAGINGLAWKDTCRLGTTANITLSGLSAIDGVTPSGGDRILVKNQTAGQDNGIYVAAVGAWPRAVDAMDGPSILNAAVFVSEGTTNADTAWVMTTNMPISVGSTPLTWAQFGAGAVYTAGNGLTLTANQFAVGAGTGIVVSPGVTAVDTTVIATQAFVNTAVTGMAKKYATTLAGTASPETITHNLNTRDIQVAVYNGATPYTAVQVDWDAATVNTVTIRYNPNLGAGYRVVVVG